MKLPAIRELVQANLRGIGSDAKLVGERLLLNCGCYAGRRFDFGSISAVWLIDDDEIRFFDRSGKLLFAICPTETTQQLVRRAA